MPDTTSTERDSSLALTNGAVPFASDGLCAFCGGPRDRDDLAVCYGCHDANVPHDPCRHTDGTAVPSVFAFLPQAWDSDAALEARGNRRHRHARYAVRRYVP